MPRDREKVRHRRQEAALELYRAHRYDETTTAEIAERAGVTERTFFRHFADKREVLFDGEAALGRILTGVLRGHNLSTLADCFHVATANEDTQIVLSTSAGKAPSLLATIHGQVRSACTICLLAP